MSRDEVTDWVKRNWWQIAATLLAATLWVARVEAAVTDMRGDHQITQGLGRLACNTDTRSAVLAGLPCRDLLKDWRFAE